MPRFIEHAQVRANRSDDARPPGLALCALLAGMLGQACVGLPPPPDIPDLSTLGPRYERPTARLPDEQTTQLLEAAQPYIDVASHLDGLALIRTAVSDTSKGLDAAIATDSLTVQGTLRAELSCPGHGAMATDDSDANGTINVTMGVSDTRIQRAMLGFATDCEFVSGRGGVTDRITFSADFSADLGEPIAIGDEPTSTLTIELTDLDVRSATGLTLPRLQDTYTFRVTPDDSIEVLLDLDLLGFADLGTLVVISRTDGSVGLREARGEWNCPRDGSCTLARSR